MKTLKIITSLILLFSMQTLMAQYGQGGYGQGGYGQGGMGGGMGGNPMNNQNQMGNQTRPQAPKERPIEELVVKVVERLKTQLTLDELQVIAISNIITDNMKKQNAVLKKEDNNDEKTAELKAISEKTDLDILILLNKDQKIKYKLLSEDAKKMQEASMRKGR
jgi:hypothetical protein